jgi:hypothetical protein
VWLGISIGAIFRLLNYLEWTSVQTFTHFVQGLPFIGFRICYILRFGIYTAGKYPRNPVQALPVLEGPAKALF